jgi:hypothetical protein
MHRSRPVLVAIGHHGADLSVAIGHHGGEMAVGPCVKERAKPTATSARVHAGAWRGSRRRTSILKLATPIIQGTVELPMGNIRVG